MPPRLKKVNKTSFPEELREWFKREVPTSDPANPRTHPLDLKELNRYSNPSPGSVSTLIKSGRVAKKKTTRKEKVIPTSMDCPAGRTRKGRASVNSQLQDEYEDLAYIDQGISNGQMVLQSVYSPPHQLPRVVDGSHGVQTRSMSESPQYTQLQPSQRMQQQQGGVLQAPSDYQLPSPGIQQHNAAAYEYADRQETPLSDDDEMEEEEMESRPISTSSSTQSRKYRIYRKASETEKEKPEYKKKRGNNNVSVRKSRVKKEEEEKEEKEKNRVDNLAKNWIIKRFMRQVGEEGSRQISTKLSPQERPIFDEIFRDVFRNRAGPSHRS